MQHQDNALLSWPHEVPAPVAHALVDAHFIRALELGPPQWWQQWQTARLAEMLAWLGAKDWWNMWAASRPGPSSPIEALAGLPIMAREDFRGLIASHAPEVPVEYGKLSDYSTSGSSGVPVTFWRSEMALRINNNHYWADHQRQGRDLTQRMCAISAYVSLQGGTHQLPPSEPWLHPGEQMTRLISQFTITEHAVWISSHPAAYLATRPDMLAGVLSTIELQKMSAPTIRQIMTYGQTVDPPLRERTRRILGASIRDRYSCEEIGPMAFQCPESDDYYHCSVANCVLEVMDSQGRHVRDGMQGNVLATGLHQWASPAVRYDLGDIATWHARCPGCGNSAPALSHLLGRKYFLLQRPSGQWHHIRILAEDWLACAAFLEYRLVQTDAKTFRAEFVLERPITESQAQATIAMLKNLVGPKYTFELAQLDAIPWPPGRKRQEFVGLMP